jgi:hypothetical protein
MARKLDLRFSITYLIAFVAIVTLELIGIDRDHHGQKLAAITDNWQWLDSKAWGPLKWLLRVLTVGFLAWVALHFGGNW